jgi:hypothetical protein
MEDRVTPYAEHVNLLKEYWRENYFKFHLKIIISFIFFKLYIKVLLLGD